jgi:hypothetical protein
VQEPQTTPTPSPEDDQGDDGSRPLTGQAGPLGGGVLEQPEVEEQGQEEPEEEQPSVDEGSEDNTNN